MKNKWLPILLLCFSFLAFSPVPASAETEEEGLAEWTVLFYFCGSDLESRYGFASGNLEEILQVNYPDLYLNFYGIESSSSQDSSAPSTSPAVNVLIQTGGSKTWHTQELEMDWDLEMEMNMDIDPTHLQRWQYLNYSIFGEQTINDRLNGFQLLDTLPLSSMAAPETLSDFIRWGCENYPAKKYALVLWDHGDGAKTGLFIDELFDNDVMYLYELKKALADGGQKMEAIIFDACLMANLETAWNIQDYANYMVASEEVVPGKGTAVDDWLYELYANPECDGKALGRLICDMTQAKYANEDDDQARSILTWSVIDLSKVDHLCKTAQSFIQSISKYYAEHPDLFVIIAQCFLDAEEYGDGRQNMVDLGDAFYNRSISRFVDRDIRNELLNSLSDTVVYTVRGSGRHGSHGLSICYPIDFSSEELDIYARNFPDPYYLAYLDAVNEWSAPDWVYDVADRLPDLSTIEAMKLEVTRLVNEDGEPGFMVQDYVTNLGGVFYRLYREDEASGSLIRLGRTPCRNVWLPTEKNLFWVFNQPMQWPALEGVPCTLDLVFRNESDSENIEYHYNIPVQIGTDIYFLRCRRHFQQIDDSAIDPFGSGFEVIYEIYGIWAGYDKDTEIVSRNVTDLSKKAGQDLRVLYPVDTSDTQEEIRYLPGESMTVYRSMWVDEQPLPPGTYYIEYELQDRFLRSYLLERIRLEWDGEHISFPDLDSWNGTVTFPQ